VSSDRFELVTNGELHNSDFSRFIGILILGKLSLKLLTWEEKSRFKFRFLGYCMILKKISIGKRPFFGVCYISRKITA
jgi:hypothetical protein